MLKLSYLEAGEMKSYTGNFAGLPNSEVTSKGSEMSVAWTWGEGDWERDLTLTMSFRLRGGGDPVQWRESERSSD